MNHNSDKSGQEHHSALFKWALVAALATGVGLLLKTEKGHEIRDEVAIKAKEMADRFTQKREDLQDKVKEIFGEVNEDLEHSYIEIKGHLLSDLNALKREAKLTKKSFDQTVDRLIEQYSEEKKWSKKVSQSLKDDLSDQWEDIQSKL